MIEINKIRVGEIWDVDEPSSDGEFGDVYLDDGETIVRVPCDWSAFVLALFNCYEGECEWSPDYGYDFDGVRGKKIFYIIDDDSGLLGAFAVYSSVAEERLRLDGFLELCEEDVV